MADAKDDKGADGGKAALPDKATDPEGYWREYYKREAADAFKARDDAKARARDLESKVLPDDELKRLRDAEQAMAAAEDERKRKAGEFDKLQQELAQRHQRELKAAADATEAEKKRAAELQTRLDQRLITATFAQASDWFGPQGKTILAPEVAQEFFAKYARVENERVILTRPDGGVIHARDGNGPAEFSDAMAELVQALPKHLQDSILRGSGKTGSGASGGGLSSDLDDIPTLTAKVRQGDKEAAKILERKLATKGGLVAGRAFQPR